MEQVLANLQGSVRRVTLDGRRYIVAPLSLIKEGVLNGSKGPLYYPLDEISKDHSAWNHMPIVVYHPTLNGVNVSARDPEVLAKSGVGFVFRSHVREGLKAEGWFDEEKTRRVDSRVYDALVSGAPMELSTGLYTDNEPVKNRAKAIHNGKRYSFVARNYRPDHLAILPDQSGACSVNDGCGLNVNAGCGIGEGGFEEGNTCAKGGGGPPSDSGKKHDVKLPKKATKLNIKTASNALEQMGYKLGKSQFSFETKKTLYEVSHPNGKKSTMSTDQIKKLVYDGANNSDRGTLMDDKKKSLWRQLGELVGVYNANPDGCNQHTGPGCGAGESLKIPEFDDTNRSGLSDEQWQSNADFRRDNYRSRRETVEMYLRGEEPLASFTHEDVTVMVMPNRGHLIVKDGDSRPAPTGDWQGWWDKDIKEVAGVGKKEYSRLPKSRQAALDAEVQAKKYAAKEFVKRRDDFWGKDATDNAQEQQSSPAEECECGGEGSEACSKKDVTENASVMQPKSKASGKYKPNGSGTGVGEQHEAAQSGAMVLTDLDKELGSLARAELEVTGNNPASWVEDEGKWEKAKAAADKGDYSDDSYWAVVAHIYKNMGGKVKEPTTDNAETDDQGSPTEQELQEGGDMPAKPLTENERKGVVSYLTTNCDCWKGDEETLNEFTDERLLKLKSGAEKAKAMDLVANTLKETEGCEGLTLNNMPAFIKATMKSSPGATAKKAATQKAAKKAEPTEPEEEDEETDEDRYRKKLAGNRRQQSEEEYLRNAPPRIRSAILNAQRIEDQERQSLIEQLTVNVSEDNLERVTKRLNATDMDGLRDLVDMLPAPVNNGGYADSGNQHEVRVPLFYGAGGGPVSNRNRQTDADKDDYLAIPVTNWEREAKSNKRNDDD